MYLLHISIICFVPADPPNNVYPAAIGAGFAGMLVAGVASLLVFQYIVRNRQNNPRECQPQSCTESYTHIGPLLISSYSWCSAAVGGGAKCRHLAAMGNVSRIMPKGDSVWVATIWAHVATWI